MCENNNRKRVAVIGAGASGLPSLRHAILYGLDATCFESAGEVGGLWRYKPSDTDESSVMKTTVINTSKEMTAYSDFPPSPDTANFMHNTEMYKYLKEYANHYKLQKYIKFHHKVINVERTSSYKKDGTWNVIYLDPEGNEKKEQFDSVILSSGHHTIPHLPQPFPGQSIFTGKIIHSHDYKDHRGFEDKTVVVVGVGNSGGDIAVELSRIAKQVYLVTRRGAWILNRIYEYGKPFDLALSTKFNAELTRLVPSVLASKYVECKLNKRFDHQSYGLKPQHRFFGAHPTVNDELPNRIASGTVRIKPNIRSFKEKSIEFMDGSVVNDVDTVIYATGFSFEFPMAENGKLIPVTENQVELYQNMFPLETSDHNTLAVIGLVQPFGSIMPISEMQARLFLENLYGKKNIVPSKDKMKEDIIMKRDDMANRYVKSRRHTIQVDYVPYMDELATIIGCNPSLTDLLKNDPLLAYKVYFGPTVPYIYRLTGPHVWNGAKKAIETVDERVFKATNSGMYQPDRTGLYVTAIIILFLALFFMFL